MDKFIHVCKHDDTTAYVGHILTGTIYVWMCGKVHAVTTLNPSESSTSTDW